MIEVYQAADLLPVLNAIHGAKATITKHNTGHLLHATVYFQDRANLSSKTQEEYGKIVEAEALRRSR